MIPPSDPETARPVAVRDGHGAPVTCSACGCRLRAGMADNDIAWFHFNPLGGRDARGCRVDCVDAPHDVAGYPAPSLAPPRIPGPRRPALRRRPVAAAGH